MKPASPPATSGSDPGMADPYATAKDTALARTHRLALALHRLEKAGGAT